MKAHDHKTSGFSLLEIMVVLILFGILIGITVPGMSNLVRSTRLKGASNTLVADIRYARSLANAQHSSYQIQFTSSNYTISRVSPATTITMRTLPDGVSCSATGTATFFAWGLTGPVTITMSSHGKSDVVQLTASGNVIHD